VRGRSGWLGDDCLDSPSPRLKGDRSILAARKAVVQTLLQLLPGVGIKAHAVAWRRPSAQSKRVPVILEILEHRWHLNLLAGDRNQPSLLDQTSQSVRCTKGKTLVFGKVSSARIECRRGCPKGAHEFDAAAGIVPYIKCNSRPSARHPFHFSQYLLLVGHEIEDQGGYDHVPTSGFDGERLRVAQLKSNPFVRHVRTSRCEEALRGIDGDQAFRVAAGQDSGRQSASAAADLQPIQVGRRFELVEEAWSNLAAPAPHVEVIAFASLPCVVTGCLRHDLLHPGAVSVPREGLYAPPHGKGRVKSAEMQLAGAGLRIAHRRFPLRPRPRRTMPRPAVMRFICPGTISSALPSLSRCIDEANHR
jgi:hypothetical protein